MNTHLPNAKEIRERAADWLQRRNFWNWSEADQAELDAWLAQSPSHMTAYLRVQAAWENTGRLSALRSIRPAQRPAPKSRRVLPLLMGVAAAAAIAAVVGSSSLSAWFGPDVKTYATKVGGHEILKLADGSEIELNTDTVLRTSMQPHERKVWLERGEAYFQVKHDEKRPFVVLAGNDRVIDLGTKFTVRREPHRLQVAVMEGRVQLQSKTASGKEHSVALARGDVVVSAGGVLPVVKKSETQLEKDVAWRSGELVFEGATLADAAREFNRYNTDKIVVAGTGVAGLTIGGKFAKNDIAAFAELAQHVLGLRVERAGNIIVITR